MEYNISVDLCRQALPALRPMRTVRVAKLEDLKPAVEAHAVGDTKRTLLITAVPGQMDGNNRKESQKLDRDHGGHGQVFVKV